MTVKIKLASDEKEVMAPEPEGVKIQIVEKDRVEKT